MVVRISHKEEITYSDETQQVRILRLLSRPLTWGKKRELFYKLSADKEPFEQFEQFKRNHKVFQQESPSKFNMGNPNKDSDGAIGNLTSPWDPTRQPEISARERSQGCCPSQASSGGHSKTDGQGSHALPGLTQ